MSRSVICGVREYPFNEDVFDKFHDNHYAKSSWPVVYLLIDKEAKEIYIGETTNIYKRMKAHLECDEKSKFNQLYIISCNKFNKSVTQEIEFNLIKYIPCDGKFRSTNDNKGFNSRNYFQKKQVYWDIFQKVWTELQNEKIVKKSLEFISNSNLFKYSPYKRLNPDQSKALVAIMENLLNSNTKTTFVEGGTGTGKSVLAVFLFALLKADTFDINLKEFGVHEKKVIDLLFKLKARYKDPTMVLVVPVSSFRTTLKKVFNIVKGLSADMVISPAELANNKYDFIFGDESHRLHKRQNLGHYFKRFDEVSAKLRFNKLKKTELDWILKQGEKVVLFYDENQTVQPSDVETVDFIKLKLLYTTSVLKLKSQLRCKGGDDYVKFIKNLMNCSFHTKPKKYSAKNYSFLMFESLRDMIKEVKLRDRENGLSRLLAGYSWKWISKKNKKLYDIKIDNVLLKWNSVTRDWINTPKAINEVGCIHTSQGYDLNYAGIILGREISYDKKKNEIIVINKNYFDRNGKAGIKDPIKLKKFIINIYTTILKRGIDGTYIYVCDPALREYMAQYIHIVKDKRASNPVRKYIVPKVNKPSRKIIPLLDVKAAAGGFSPEQLAYGKKIVLPDGINPASNMFACQVVGDSMNKVIPSGSICLFKLDEGGSRDGKIVLVQHSIIQDRAMGSGFTVKRYTSKKSVEGDKWHHTSITLQPMSDDNSFQPIELHKDQLVELEVIGIFDRVLYTDGAADHIID